MLYYITIWIICIGSRESGKNKKKEMEEHENIAFQSCGRYCGTCLKLLLEFTRQSSASKMRRLSSCTFLLVFPHARYILREYLLERTTVCSLLYRKSYPSFTSTVRFAISIFFYPLIIYLCFLSIRLAVDFYLRNRLYEYILATFFYHFLSFYLYRMSLFEIVLSSSSLCFTFESNIAYCYMSAITAIKFYYFKLKLLLDFNWILVRILSSLVSKCFDSWNILTLERRNSRLYILRFFNVCVFECVPLAFYYRLIRFYNFTSIFLNTYFFKL